MRKHWTDGLIPAAQRQQLRRIDRWHDRKAASERGATPGIELWTTRSKQSQEVVCNR